MALLNSVNPHDQSLVGSLTISTQKEVFGAVASARRALPGWASTSISDRANYLTRLNKLLVKNRKELAELVTKEMGKPIKQSLDDIDWEMSYIKWYASEGTKALENENIGKTDKVKYEIAYEPWGVVAAIAPWNFPYSMASSGISPALLAGNTVVFKPSEHTSLSQKMFVDLLESTGLPKGVLNIVIGDGKVGKLLTSSDIDFVWFTGSTPVGQEIYKKAADKFIKASLELGGSDPAIVLGDIDPKTVINDIYWGRFLNCGQVCSSIKRLFVHKSIYKDVVSGLAKKLEMAKVGNPFEDESDIGPLVSKYQLTKLEKQVDDSVKKGAKIEIGGKRPIDPNLSKGNYYLPTILTNVNFDMPVMNEEVFGPVLPIIPFSNDDDAVEMANNTQWGLSAYIYTKDINKGRLLASKIKSGSVGVNTDALYEPFCPIGGAKQSGIGKEYGIHGVREFAQMKLLAIKQ
jgi:succinate-semialdehyde dehydrogenase / glutarate-semialdehyde dehydrogenase